MCINGLFVGNEIFLRQRVQWKITFVLNSSLKVSEITF